MKYYLIILLNIVIYATTSAQLKVYNPGAEQGPKQFTGQFGDTLKVDLKTIHLDPESIFNMPSDSGESSPPY